MMDNYVLASVFILVIKCISGHPQCLDFRPPFELVNSLQFCTTYASYGCCANQRDSEIRQLYKDIINRLSSRGLGSNVCDIFIKDILCQECSPYAAHIFDAETSEKRDFPGLCSSYCIPMVQQCASVVPYIVNNTKLLNRLSQTEAFCEYISLQDVDYCYPDLLTNDILNGNISRTMITQDGCLCLERITFGLRNPLALESANDNTQRLFIAEQLGVVYILDRNGTLLSKPFLNLSDLVLTSNRRGDERGFLGLAFHPKYAENGRLFIYYSVNHAGQEKTRLSELGVSTTDQNEVNKTSEKVILEIDQPFWNHNGGEILFDAYGYLLVFVGDGGSGGDPFNYAQNKGVLLGKVLRIDVDRSTNTSSYSIPEDNPFKNETGARLEIYAYGIRNIWRCDIDEGDPVTGENRGRIICGDVGQNAYEELDIIVKGGNYGWNTREGFECYKGSPSCGNIESEELPIYAYPHTFGKSVTGGHVYRGCMNPNLNGKYIYGDYVSGRLFSLVENDGQWSNSELFMCGPDICFNGLESYFPVSILSFGEDEQGEIYMLATEDPKTDAPVGSVYRLIDPKRRGDPSTCRSTQIRTVDHEQDSRPNTANAVRRGEFASVVHCVFIPVMTCCSMLIKDVDNL